MDHDVRELLELCHLAARPEWDLVVAGEGNASVVTERGTLHVTASGARLSDMAANAVTEIQPELLIAGLDGAGTDVEWAQSVRRSQLDSVAARPTVEAGLHAVISQACGGRLVLHTHPTRLLAILSSDRAEWFSRTRLCPDHVVMCGPADCLVPCVDPGRKLADAARTAVHRFREMYGRPPVTILLGNHGLVTVGGSVPEVVDRALMTVKMARVAVDALSIGAVRGLPPVEVARIDGREDENFRRNVLRNGPPDVRS